MYCGRHRCWLILARAHLMLQIQNMPFRPVRLFCVLSLGFLGPMILRVPASLAQTLTPVPPYLIRSWQTEEGLPQNSVTALVQTRDGYLWLGTYGGLVRFDGVRFTVFDSDNT